MTSNDDLIQHVYAFFLKAYRQATPDATGGEVVAFEPMGFSPGLQGANVAAAALEEVSQLANILPQIDGGIFRRTGRTVSVQYAVILNEAQPSSAESTATFGNVKSQASKMYSDAASDGELDGPKATFASPIEWYDHSNPSNWTSYSYDSRAKSDAQARPAPLAANVHIVWHVVSHEMRPLILRRPVEPPSPAGGLIERQPIQANVARPMSAGAPALQRNLVRHMAGPIPLGVAARPMERPAIALTARLSVAKIKEHTAPQKVEAPGFTMKFDYSLVRLRRPWLSGDFLSTPGWYVPGQRSGEYSKGEPENTGWFAVVPMAFIAVKNLVIHGEWSDSDAAAAENSAAFGPFSLLGSSTYQHSALVNPGIQIIAWICGVQPKLPPDTDPSLPPAPTPAG